MSKMRSRAEALAAEFNIANVSGLKQNKRLTTKYGVLQNKEQANMGRFT